jgi:hypothetical protein
MQDQIKNVKESYPTGGSIGQVSTCCSRQSAKAVLKDKIHRLRNKANNLEILCNTLPEVLSSEQDEAIWSLAVEINFI